MKTCAFELLVRGVTLNTIGSIFAKKEPNSFKSLIKSHLHQTEINLNGETTHSINEQFSAVH